MTETIRMGGAGGDGILLKKYEDMIFPNVDPVDPVRGLKRLKEFQYKEGDIVICTYPKSGTHWIGNMILKLKSLDASDRQQDALLEFDPPAETYDDQKYPRIIFTHQKPSLLYPSKISNSKGRVVLMLRNPKDVMVSFYHLLKDSIILNNKQSWEEFFQSCIDGEVPFGSYFTYLREWDATLKEVSEGKSSLQIKVFYYEDCKINPKENIKRLHEFLGFDRDDKYLDQVLEETTFGSLRAHYNSDKQASKDPFCIDEAGKYIIFRKGEVGDWKTHFTVPQSEMVDKLLTESLQHGMIKFKFEI